jgi:hypothetical protein
LVASSLNRAGTMPFENRSRIAGFYLPGFPNIQSLKLKTFDSAKRHNLVRAVEVLRLLHCGRGFVIDAGGSAAIRLEKRQMSDAGEDDDRAGIRNDHVALNARPRWRTLELVPRCSLRTVGTSYPPSAREIPGVRDRSSRLAPPTQIEAQEIHN